jgi:hypothetical protein
VSQAVLYTAELLKICGRRAWLPIRSADDFKEIY